jgi:hypothetical protein
VTRSFAPLPAFEFYVLLCTDAGVLAADEVAHLAQQFRSADIVVRIDRDIDMAAVGSDSRQLSCAALDFLCIFFRLDRHSCLSTIGHLYCEGDHKNHS